ncbi:MAG: hypothetical protein HZC01_01475 [Candidatus Kerfeldbacteria bacterium]|nr:hypothetical protein [Candidatus Kerfeldbacteria bacterium]
MLALLMAIMVRLGQAAPVPLYLRFQEEARTALDSLSQVGDTTGMAQLIVLHNLAFHHYPDSRDQAERLLKKSFKHDTTTLVQAYRGSLAMIKVSDRGKAGNALRGIGKLFGVSGSAYDEARDGFKKITEALIRDSLGGHHQVQLRLIRATAAAEALGFLPELMDEATADLTWLQEHVPQSDSAVYFFVQLTWAKYYYAASQSALYPPIQTVLLRESKRYLAIAYPSAVSPVLLREYIFWLTRVG